MSIVDISFDEIVNAAKARVKKNSEKRHRAAVLEITKGRYQPDLCEILDALNWACNHGGPTGWDESEVTRHLMDHLVVVNAVADHAVDVILEDIEYEEEVG